MNHMTDIRRENGRLAIEKAGGASKLARKMGYTNASFLVQQFGPNPSRSPTDATMRKMEEAIGLESGVLDADPAKAKNDSVSTEMITNVIRVVGSAMGQEHIGGLSPDKHAELIALVLNDTLEHGRRVSDQLCVGHVRVVAVAVFSRANQSFTGPYLQASHHYPRPRCRLLCAHFPPPCFSLAR